MEDVPREAYRQAMHAAKIMTFLETICKLGSGLGQKVTLGDARMVISALSRGDIDRDEARDLLRKKLRKKLRGK